MGTGRKNSTIGTVVAVALITASSIVANTSTAEAATGNQGYAVYRDGVGPDWHAAIMDDPHYNTTSLPVIHHPGPGYYVRWGSWSEFLGGHTYTGVYRPKTSPSSAARDNFVTMGRKLISERIPYDLYFQVQYNSFTAGTWVDPGEITGIRCDGVVEYVFEWYGYRVYGNDGLWDVTSNNLVIKTLHSGVAITPKIQANSYLTRITTAKP